jgi:hypothetical protein
MEKKVFNLIILDESGSMESIAEATISGLNETIQSIKHAQEKFANQKHFVSLMSFNSGGRKYHYDCVEAKEISFFNGKDYQPDNCTPLYDAIGSGISRLRRQITDDDQVLVTIITDGLENNSHEYNFESIATLIEKMKSHGWMITYIGANQDAILTAHKMHIDNGLNYNATPEGVNNMMQFERKSRDRFYNAVDLCEDSCLSADEINGMNFFEEDDDKDKKKEK